MSLHSEKIQDNWEKLIQIIKNTFTEEDRRQKILKMYRDLESRMIVAPASSRNYFHNCFPGGYVAHVLNVINFSQELHRLWKQSGASTDNYTEEELIFAAMHHDLGKVGDHEREHYIPNPSEWHRKNQGKLYNMNPEIQYMTVPDRSFWLLNYFEIKISINEFLGIKLADGPFDESNIHYFKSFVPEKQLKVNLPYIVHQADLMASRIEREAEIYNDKKENEAMNKKIKKVFNNSDNNKKQDIKNLKKKFDELFSEE
jgi:hypothetical protein|tara:strand:- start:4862 stop:5632 length:771 start_codon:yes stop_codon:yes gene_type:complete